MPVVVNQPQKPQEIPTLRNQLSNQKALMSEALERLLAHQDGLPTSAIGGPDEQDGFGCAGLVALALQGHDYFLDQLPSSADAKAMAMALNHGDRIIGVLKKNGVLS